MKEQRKGVNRRQKEKGDYSALDWKALEGAAQSLWVDSMDLASSTYCITCLTQYI